VRSWEQSFSQEQKPTCSCHSRHLPVACQLVLSCNDDHHIQLHTPFDVHILVVMGAVSLGAELPVLHPCAAAGVLAHSIAGQNYHQ